MPETAVSHMIFNRTILFLKSGQTAIEHIELIHRAFLHRIELGQLGILNFD
jgi:hypothetical protein